MMERICCPLREQVTKEKWKMIREGWGSVMPEEWCFLNTEAFDQGPQESAGGWKGQCRGMERVVCCEARQQEYKRKLGTERHRSEWCRQWGERMGRGVRGGELSRWQRWLQALCFSVGRSDPGGSVRRRGSFRCDVLGKFLCCLDGPKIYFVFQQSIVFQQRWSLSL